MYRKRRQFILLLVSSIIIFLVFLWRTSDRKSQDAALGRDWPRDCPKLALILCEDTGSPSETSFERQINQTLTLIKSVLITTKKRDCVHLVLISEKRKHFDRIKNQIFENSGKWDLEFTNGLHLEFVALRYPNGTEWIRGLYRNHPCSSFRLFLPSLLPFDSVILSDTDILYLRNIRDLWSELNNFNSSALVGMALSLRPTPPGGMPHYGAAGITTFVMLMNLTRMRARMWTERVLALGNPYLAKLKTGLAEQGMMNVYFHYPEEMHPLSCDWNFRYSQCNQARLCTEEGIKGGVSALHGMSNAFTQAGPEPLFRHVYQTFVEAQLKTFSLTKLIRKLESGVTSLMVGRGSPCAKATTFGQDVLRRLKLKVLEAAE